jgi:Dolichyl-phosphate-mannose-protein mannosyltransferase
MDRARQWLSRLDIGELTVVLSLLALCVLVRVLRLQPIEYYDDEVSRWSFVRQWFYDNSFRHAAWTHHMARFGLNVPLFVVQALFGRHASVYYVWPIASFALQVLLTYALAKRLGGRATGVLAAILLAVFPGMDRGASQLLPDAFGGTAMILLAYLLARYHDAEFERRRRWLVGSALALVWAYAIKESNLLFVPGALLAVWLCRGIWRDTLTFLATLGAAIALETVALRIFTDYSSRFAIVAEAHGRATATFWQLFERFERLEPAWQMLVWSWVPAGIWLLGSQDKRRRALVVIVAAFVFLLTFLVRSVDPIVLWTRFFSRYFEPAAPLMVTAVALFVRAAVTRAWSVNAPPSMAARATRLRAFGSPLAIGACILVGAAERSALDTFHEPALDEVRRIASVTNDAYARNLPIVMPRGDPNDLEERRVRPLKLVYGVYLDDTEIMKSPLAADGRLPDVLEAIHDGQLYSFLLRDPAPYDEARLRSWVERGCAVVLEEGPGHLLASAGVTSLILKRRQKLAPSCQPPAR